MSVTKAGMVAAINGAVPLEIREEILSKIDDGFMARACGAVQITDGHAPTPTSRPSSHL
jgi:hypothetical protein